MSKLERKAPAQPPAQYAVIGFPIAHSRSPFIHARFAHASGEHLEYGAISARPEHFQAVVARFQRAGGLGLNVTTPHKEAARELARELSNRAEQAGAVNTLSWRGDHWFGDNTDGVGLVTDLSVNLGIRLKDADCLMLGAGGAAQGVARPLLEAGLGNLTIVNRTAERAHRLARSLADERVQGFGMDAIPDRRFDLVINATAAALSGEALQIPAGSIDAGSCCYDMMYGAEPTAFLRFARDAGCTNLSDGRGMLVEQAAESFFIWRGKRVSTAAVIAALSDLLEPA
ncbi:MAG: shikimate dehydrogenase [Gammaproteobacteria bacterium]|nr:shikimate dehydrogenase [Gammaproteobacteria bacterium]